LTDTPFAIKRVLTIAGSDSGGGAGIQADLKTISLLGGYGMSVVTALTAQNTVGVRDIHEVPLSFIEEQFDAVMEDIGVDAAKTGMLSNRGVVELVARKVKQYDIRSLVVDPVMVAKSGDTLLSDDARGAVATELLPLSLVVTPNLSEAAILSGKEVRTEEDMKEAALAIHEMGARNVLVKGGHLKGRPVDLLYDGDSFREFVAERIQTRNTHGTGCTFSSAITTLIAQGLAVPEAVGKAKEFLTDAIRYGIDLGRGHGPTNPYAPLARELARYEAFVAVSEGIKRLSREEVGHLVPEVRSNLGYAVPFARGPQDVVAVPGRITEVDGRMVATSSPAFGASRHVANTILAAMTRDASMRSAMNIRYSPELLSICRDLGFRVASFSRRDEPGEVKEKEGSTLLWGTKRALERAKEFPDILYDEGDVGKEPMIRVFGRNPAEVVSKVLAIGGGEPGWAE